MDVVTRVELEYSYGAGDGQTRSRVVSMPKEKSGGPRLDQSCDWEKYGYDSIPLLGPSPRGFSADATYSARSTIGTNRRIRLRSR